MKVSIFVFLTFFLRTIVSKTFLVIVKEVTKLHDLYWVRYIGLHIDKQAIFYIRKTNLIEGSHPLKHQLARYVRETYVAELKGTIKVNYR